MVQHNQTPVMIMAAIQNIKLVKLIMVLILLAPQDEIRSPKHQKSIPATKTQLISKVQEDQNSP